MQRLVVGASWELCFSNLLRHIRFEYLEKCLTASNLGYFKKEKKNMAQKNLICMKIRTEISTVTLQAFLG